jgi:hypothetical protein
MYTIGLPIYQIYRRKEFYPRQDTDNTLGGDPVLLPAGTPIAIVRRGGKGSDKCLVQAGDLFAWIWEGAIEPLGASN